MVHHGVARPRRRIIGCGDPEVVVVGGVPVEEAPVVQVPVAGTFVVKAGHLNDESVASHRVHGQHACFPPDPAVESVDDPGLVIPGFAVLNAAHPNA